MSDLQNKNVREWFDKVKTDDIELRVQYILRNMDAIWFGEPKFVLEELNKIDGVEVVFRGTGCTVEAGRYHWLIRLDSSRPGIHGPRDIPQACICFFYVQNKNGEWEPK